MDQPADRATPQHQQQPSQPSVPNSPSLTSNHDEDHARMEDHRLDLAEEERPPTPPASTPQQTSSNHTTEQRSIPAAPPAAGTASTNQQDQPQTQTGSEGDGTAHGEATLPTADQQPPPPPSDGADAAEDPPEHAPEPSGLTVLGAGRAQERHNAAQDEAQAAAQTGLGHLLSTVLSSMRSMVPGAAQQQSQTSGDSASTAAGNARPTNAGEQTRQAPAQETQDGATAEGQQQQQGGAPSVLYFRMPFNGPDGSPAMLAFHPTPLPHAPVNQQQQAAAPSDGDGTQPQQPASTPPGLEDTGAHPHPGGHVPRAPLFVPLGASPLPFSFIFDAATSTAWPIVHVVPGSPPGGPAPDSASGADASEDQQPRLVAGPPFRIQLDVHFVPPPFAPEPERPDPDKARAYVKALERADAELRSRMARLNMGDIGAFAGGGADGDGDALLGCGICLDSYEADDRPEWIGGEKSEDEAVVAVPCAGHHTLHAGCLRDWLGKTPPSQWNCPFCRAGLDPSHPNLPSTASSGGSSAATNVTGGKNAGLSSSPIASTTTLRDEVRRRERQRGWRCDAPACLPRYPLPPPTQAKSNEADVAPATVDAGSTVPSLATIERHTALNEVTDESSTDLVALAPCHHQVHLDCLCTSMRVEASAVEESVYSCSGEEDAEEEEEEEDIDEQQVGDEKAIVSGNGGKREREEKEKEKPTSTVGKWVNCPACRKECWAQLPIRRKPRERKKGRQAAEDEEANAVVA